MWNFSFIHFGVNLWCISYSINIQLPRPEKATCGLAVDECVYCCREFHVVAYGTLLLWVWRGSVTDLCVLRNGDWNS